MSQVGEEKAEEPPVPKRLPIGICAHCGHDSFWHTEDGSCVGPYYSGCYRRCTSMTGDMLNTHEIKDWHGRYI